MGGTMIAKSDEKRAALDSHESAKDPRTRPIMRPRRSRTKSLDYLWLLGKAHTGEGVKSRQLRRGKRGLKA